MIPNSDIHLMSVNMSMNSNDTLYFASASAQSSFFISKAKYSYDNMMYQRLNKLSIRVETRFELVNTCNYLMFRNTSYGNKWFYAWITACHYINDNCTQIDYAIDYLQTYFFELKPGNAYVERQHSITDMIGDNILPEPVSLGEYVYNDTYTYDLLKTYWIIVAYVDDTIETQQFANIPSSSELRCYNPNSSADMEKLSDFLKSLEATPDKVIDIYMCPSAILPAGSLAGNRVLPNQQPRTYTLTAPSVTKLSLLDGYQAKNAKCYTYPYQYFLLTNSNGDTLQTRYEFFSQNTPTFQVVGSYISPVQIAAYPLNYKSIDIDLNTNVVVKDFPKIAWNYSIYKQWQSNLAFNTMENVAQSVLNPIGMVAAAGTGLISNFIGQYNPANNRAVSKGTQNIGNINNTMQRNTFTYARVSQSKDYIQVIDNFFDRYGYAQERYMSVNYNYRPHWNYVKTKNLYVYGNADENAKVEFSKIFNNGIRFWKTENEIGNYYLDNCIS